MLLPFPPGPDVHLLSQWLAQNAPWLLPVYDAVNSEALSQVARWVLWAVGFPVIYLWRQRPKSRGTEYRLPTVRVRRRRRLADRQEPWLPFEDER